MAWELNLSMLPVTPTISIPRRELIINFVRSSGPGGQNVNKVATAVQLRFNVRTSPLLAEEIKARLSKLAGNRMTQDGEIVIEAKRYRTQEQNRSDAEQRLIALIRKALIRPKRRRPTHPTTSSQMRRVESKKLRGKTKILRKSLDE
ncbi:MAG TPA: alternative ribosome rescue aminoacyl-tRNA hydrolase ArfB [Anaerolineales bacterium]